MQERNEWKTLLYELYDLMAFAPRQKSDGYVALNISKMRTQLNTHMGSLENVFNGQASNLQAYSFSIRLIVLTLN